MEITQKWPCLIYVIGCPGSGKGTICKKLAEHFACVHISLGDLFRNICSHPEEYNVDIAEYVSQGKLIPTGMLLRVFQKTVFRGPEKDQRILLIDGFPRQIEQGIAAEPQGLTPDLVLFFDCGKEIAKERYLTRKLEGRLDDDEALFETRYKEFAGLNPAVIAYYSSLGKLVKINSEGETEVTYEKVISALNSRNEWSEIQAEAIHELMKRLLNDAP